MGLQCKPQGKMRSYFAKLQNKFEKKKSAERQQTASSQKKEEK